MNSSLAKRAVGVTLAAAVLQLLMIIAFSWPAVRTAPNDVPIVTAGPQAAAVAERLDRQRPGAFAAAAVADEAAARAALADREAYGAIVTTPAGPRVLVASAASPAVAQQLTQLGVQLAGAPAGGAVQDVVAADPDDPRGAGFGALALPLIMSSLAAAVLLTFALPRLGARAAALVAFAILGGLAVTWLAQGWLSVLPGSYPAVAAVMALTILAVSGTVTGLAAVLGRAGIGLGALTLLLLGNPLSGATSAPELLPQPWGDLGQLLPPGAAATLLRSVAFFDGAGAGGALTVLLAWAAAGLLLLGAGALRGRRGEAPAAAEREPAMAS
ncbi:hypothetical protein [Spirillospora sp. NPDC029432]|uniref:hypothetical protein n=1 Tax=Spirillospora sp. NPDC029432 TaxID=3154599 RepID=UPI0034533688